MLREGGCLSPFGEKKRKKEERKVSLKLIMTTYNILFFFLHKSLECYIY